MLKEKYVQILKQIFTVSLPVVFILLANLAVSAHFRFFCPVKFLLHHDCWGCGLTRAIAALSRLHFKQAFDLNPLIIVIVPLLFLIWFLMLKKVFSK